MHWQVLYDVRIGYVHTDGFDFLHDVEQDGTKKDLMVVCWGPSVCGMRVAAVELHKWGACCTSNPKYSCPGGSDVAR